MNALALVRANILLLLLLGWQGPAAQQAAHNGTLPSPQTESGGQQSLRILSVPKIETESKKDAWDETLVIATCILVAVGAFQIVFLWQTVQAAYANAMAAKQNADALIASERAWVMADVKFASTGLMKNISSNGAVRTGAVVDVTCKNSGPTPAWIFEQFVRIEVIPVVIGSKQAYPTPQFPGGGDVGSVQHANYRILPISRGDDPYQWRAPVDCEGWATPANGLCTYILGVVRYRDAFSSLRETYFGYWVDPNGTLQRIPNEAYNKHV